jgi:hypothetical protein
VFSASIQSEFSRKAKSYNKITKRDILVVKVAEQAANKAELAANKAEKE